MFNNAAQIWNHTFYWNGLKPNGGGTPTGALLDAINAKFAATIPKASYAAYSATGLPVNP